jgi:hypothetical protein
MVSFRGRTVLRRRTFHHQVLVKQMQKIIDRLVDRYWLVVFIFCAIWIAMAGFIWTYITKDKND